MNTIVLSNSNILLNDLKWYNIYTLSFDRIMSNKGHMELVEKYRTSISLLYKREWIHINTLFRSLYFLKKYNNKIYTKIIPRVKKFLNIYNTKILVYNIDNAELEILDDINIYYTQYLDYNNFIYSLKKICH